VENEQDRPLPATPLRLLGLAWAAMALLCVLTFWQSPYLLDLASPFRVHLLIGLLLTGLPLTLLLPHRNRWVFVGLPLAISITFLSYLLPRSTKLDPARCGQARMAVANIYSGNLDLSRLAAWTEKENPDLLFVVEVTGAHVAQLQSLPFPYKSLHPRQSNFGLALLAKTAPSKLEVLEEDTPFPSLLGTWPEYRVLMTHPIPPISMAARQVGDEQVARLFAKLEASPGPPLLVIGDLNATGWDLRLEPLKLAGMQEARLGHGLLPTWPADRPVLGIPIDHIFLPPGWESRDCRRGPQIGSDHYPLVADVAWPRRSSG
jgi:endonuclease/exonuclease/phosphatase (EEP) superfamily protein YafD